MKYNVADVYKFHKFDCPAASDTIWCYKQIQNNIYQIRKPLRLQNQLTCGVTTANISRRDTFSENSGLFFIISNSAICTQLCMMEHDELLEIGCASTMPVIFNVFSIQCLLPRNSARFFAFVPVYWRFESFGYDAVSRDSSSWRFGKAHFLYRQEHRHQAWFISHTLNLLKPTGYFTYHQGLTFKNSTRFSLCVECFVRISQQTATFTLYIINWLVFITVVGRVYCAVRTDSLYKADYVSSLKG